MTVLATALPQSAVAERARRDSRNVDSGDFAGVIGDGAERQPTPRDVSARNRVGLVPGVDGLPFQPPPVVDSSPLYPEPQRDGLPYQPAPDVDALPFQPEPAPDGLPFQPSPMVDGLPFQPDRLPDGLPFEQSATGDGLLTNQRLAQMLWLWSDQATQS